MTGYMFRNAEYRRSLKSSLASADFAELGPGGAEVSSSAAALPPVRGQITVSLGPGMSARVDAAAYMAELRSEVSCTPLPAPP